MASREVAGGRPRRPIPSTTQGSSRWGRKKSPF
jgi:hypothetical protein